MASKVSLWASDYFAIRRTTHASVTYRRIANAIGESGLVRKSLFFLFCGDPKF